MKKINQLVIVSIFILAFSCKAKKRTLPYTLSEEERIEYARDFFVCKCLDYSFTEDTKNGINNEDISKSILVDVGDLWVDGGRISKMANDSAMTIRPSQISDYENKKPIISRCISMSRKIPKDSLIRKLK